MPCFQSAAAAAAVAAAAVDVVDDDRIVAACFQLHLVRLNGFDVGRR